MAGGRRALVVLPEFGPSLPALLRARGRAAPALALLGVAVLAVVLLVARRGGDAELRHGQAPAFRMTYDPEVLRRVAPRAGELARLEGRHLALVVRRLPAAGATDLPIAASRYAAALRERLRGFALRAQRPARVGDAAGYELRYRARRRLAGQAILLVAPTGTADGVVLTLERRRGNGRGVLEPAREALFSFRFVAAPR